VPVGAEHARFIPAHAGNALSGNTSPTNVLPLAPNSYQCKQMTPPYPVSPEPVPLAPPTEDDPASLTIPGIPSAISAAGGGENCTSVSPSKSTGSRRFGPAVSKAKPESVAADQAIAADPPPSSATTSPQIRSRV